MKRTYSNETECFMPECLNNINGYCQCKPHNVTPGDWECGQYTIPEVLKEK